MPIESILIAAVTLIICGAACFYMYIRQSHFEKKLMMVESILVDVKMAMDTIMTEGVMPVPAPIAGPGQPAPFTAGRDAAAVPEENFYSSVLAAAHEDAAGDSFAGEVPPSAADEILAAMQRAEQVDASPASAEGIPPLEDDEDEASVVSAPGAAAAAATQATATAAATTITQGPNLDAMSKQELISLAEQRGLRAKKTMNRSELLKLLRGASPLQNRESESGIENGSDSRNALFPDAAPIDGDYPVDLGQN